MAKILDVSKSQADRIKTNLQKAGYLKLKKRYKTICMSDKPDFSLIKFLPPNRRYSVQRRTVKKKAVYEFRERSFDEMFSCMDFKKQKTTVKRIGFKGVGSAGS